MPAAHRTSLLPWCWAGRTNRVAYCKSASKVKLAVPGCARGEWRSSVDAFQHLPGNLQFHLIFESFICGSLRALTCSRSSLPPVTGLKCKYAWPLEIDQRLCGFLMRVGSKMRLPSMRTRKMVSQLGSPHSTRDRREISINLPKYWHEKIY